MTTNMRQAAQYAEYLLQCSKQRPASLLSSPPSSSSKQKSIHQKLVDLYIEESQKQPEGKELDYATHLLAKLVRREKLNCLILNLYPANEGYSLMLKARNGVESETIKLPYEENELLEYIDAAQLPPFLVDLLEKAQVNVFYNGCVIVEVRDFRRSTIGSHDSQYVMLKPTPQSLLCDINALTNDGNRWTQEDIFQLESQLLMATEEPICLDPSPAVLLINNRIQFQQKQLNDPMLKRCVKKFTQAAVNRKRKLAQAPAPPELKLHDFIHKRKDKNRANPPVNLKVGKTCVDMWRQRPMQLSPPESVNVEEHAKVMKAPQTFVNSLNLVEEHTLERDPNQERRMLAKITIYQQTSNDSFIGELYLDHDYCNDKPSDGRTCQFGLGSWENVEKYFEQFRELFTEEGRRSVKITTQRPNQPASVVYTQTTQSSNATSITITNAQALLKHATSLAATITTQNEPTGSAGLAAKRNMPIQLSLSLGPPGSGSINAQANIISPQTATATISQSSVSQATSLPTQQLTLTQANQSHSSSQRTKPFSIHSSHSRVTGTPSPVSTPTSNTTAQHQLMTASVTSSQAGSQKIPTPAATPTPPPAARTPTPTSSTPRRTSTSESISVSHSSQNLPQATNLTTYLQGLTSTAGLNVQTSTADSTTSIAQQPNITTSINITNLGLPQNFNLGSLAGLQGVNIANIQGLQNMQVSLTGVSMPGGGIAVPVPITMINNNPSLLPNQGILVSSLPNMAASVTSASTDSTATSTAAQPNSQQPTSAVTSPHSFVTMVTALPATTASSTSVTSTSMASTVVMSSGLASNSTTVLPSQSTGMLSLPYGLAGNLAHLMPVGVGKTSSAGSGLRAQPASASAATASLPLLQIQGQPGIQLLNLPQHRGGGQVKTSHLQSSGGPTQPSARGAGVTTTVPISTVLTSQQMAALSSLTVGKPQQQLMQLTGPTGMQPSQLQTQLTFQKTQPAAAQQHLQFHQLQLKQPTASPAPQSGSHSKSKSKKRTTPTPPKN